MDSRFRGNDGGGGGLPEIRACPGDKGDNAPDIRARAEDPSLRATLFPVLTRHPRARRIRLDGVTDGVLWPDIRARAEDPEGQWPVSQEWPPTSARARRIHFWKIDN